MKGTRLGIAALLTTGLAALGPGASAGGPPAVDPSTLTPALNPAFAPYTCLTVGDGIICRGGKDDHYDDLTDLECDGRAVHVRGSERVVITRWHDAEGRATATELHTDVDDTLSLESGAGSSVRLFAHWQKHYVYPVPGDASARVLRETGGIVRVRAPGEVLFQDTGFVEFVPDEEYEGVAVSHGIHDRFAAGADLDQAICAGLDG